MAKGHVNNRDDGRGHCQNVASEVEDADCLFHDAFLPLVAIGPAGSVDRHERGPCRGTTDVLVCSVATRRGADQQGGHTAAGQVRYFGRTSAASLSGRAWAAGGLAGMGRSVDPSQWPGPSAARSWFEHLSRIRADHGMPTEEVIAEGMGLKSRSRVSALLRNALPKNDEQAEKLLEALGAWPGQKLFGKDLYGVIKDNPHEVSAVAPRGVRKGNKEEAFEREAHLEMRVHRTVFSLPCIERDVEAEIRGYLQKGRPVLLVGPSMVGKTRIAATVIKNAYDEQAWLIPGTKEALAALGSAAPPAHDAMIFLDDIERLLGVGGITQAEFFGLAKRNVIVGTVREHKYDAYLPTDQLRLLEWDILSIFSRVFVKRVLSTREEARLRDAVPDSELCDRIIRVGIGEYVGAAQVIADALRTGNPLGRALVLGVADWARAGMRKPVPRALLRELAMAHLDTRNRLRLSDDQGFEDALQWATREINPTVSLLQPEDHDCFGIFDYALDLLAVSGNPIPQGAWPLFIESADPAELVAIGQAAKRDGRLQVAEQAWRAAEEAEDPESAAFGALYLGSLLAGQGRTGDARSAYERAISHWKTQAGPVAAFDLGYMLKESDLDRAIDLYQKAIDSGHWWAAPASAYNLGNLLNSQGDTAGAERAYQKAIDLDLDLAQIKDIVRKRLEGKGVPTVFEVIDARRYPPDPEITVRAAIKLAQLQAARRDLKAARKTYLRLTRAGSSCIAASAMLSLGNLLYKHGDRLGAEEAYSRAMEVGEAEVGPKAAVNLGGLLIKNDDVERGRRALQYAVDSGHPEAGASAALTLGSLLERDGDTDEAKVMYQQAVDCAVPEIAEAARRRLNALT